jgi:hypothetical protein
MYRHSQVIIKDLQIVITKRTVQRYMTVQINKTLMYTRRVQKKNELLLLRLFYILSTAPFKVVPSTGDTPFPMFLPLLECFLERTFCDGAHFSYRIFLNLRVLKKRPNFLNSSPTSIMLIAKRGKWQFVVKTCR